MLDKVVVVAGAAGLLGRNFASCIVRNGGTAVLGDVDEEAASEHAKSLANIGPGTADACRLDITSAPSIESMLEYVSTRYGRIDAFVNSAYPRNQAYGARLEEVTYPNFCDNIGRNLGGYFLAAQQFALFFRRQGYGNIVNIGSIYATMVPRFEIYDGTTMTMPVEYAAIKSAVVQLTRYFAQYFKSDGIRVNCISPGGIFDSQPEPFLSNYRQHCARKGMLSAVDLEGILLLLLSDASDMITGQNFIVDDGFSL